MYYNTCPHCGAHLDPDEHCDCLARVRPRQILPHAVRLTASAADINKPAQENPHRQLPYPRHDGPHEVCA